MTMTVSYLTINGEILSETRDGVESDYIPDPLGSTAALIDSSHTITDTFTWRPYGEQRSHSGSSVTPFGYTGTLGCYTDSASNRIYEHARVFLPQTTVWQTADPLWPGQLAYAYCGGSPAVGADPSGWSPGSNFAWCMNWWTSKGFSARQACNRCKYYLTRPKNYSCGGYPDKGYPLVPPGAFPYLHNLYNDFPSCSTGDKSDCWACCQDLLLAGPGGTNTLIGFFPPDWTGLLPTVPVGSFPHVSCLTSCTNACMTAQSPGEGYVAAVCTALECGTGQGKDLCMKMLRPYIPYMQTTNICPR